MDWQFERLYFDGDHYFSELLRAIGQARTSIDLETYIFSPDPIGREVEAALSAAASRGVQVRLLVDGVGAMNWVEKRSPELKASSVKIRIYHPLAFAHVLQFITRLAATQLRLFFHKRIETYKTRRVLFRLNKRDHRKICIIDGIRAWVGSLNVSADHSAKVRGNQAWRDTAIAIEGERVSDLKSAFDHTWIRSHTPDGRRPWREALKQLPRQFPRQFRAHSPLVRLNYTSRLRRASFRDFSRRLKESQTRIWITNAYLAPSAPVMRLLRQAARRGADVRLLVPRKSDVFFMPWVASSHYAPLLKDGVRIFEYLPRFLHAKSAIIDDWMIVGSSNMNRRSLLNDLEVDVVLMNLDAQTELVQQFHRDLVESVEIKTAPDGLSSRIGRLLTLFFKNWI